MHDGNEQPHHQEPAIDGEGNEAVHSVRIS